MIKTNFIIHTSSPDRGLEHLLKMWPDIKKAVPNAELHVAYGFQLFDVAHADNPGAMMWKENILKLMTYDGVRDHGRLAQPDLAELMKECAIWAYPTHFDEINCISALKAQYYGCEPIVINKGALKETVQFGRKIEGDIYEDAIKEKYKEQIIDALKNPISKAKREEMMAWAKQFEWATVAKQWSEEMRKNG